MSSFARELMAGMPDCVSHATVIFNLGAAC